MKPVRRKMCFPAVEVRLPPWTELFLAKAGMVFTDVEDRMRLVIELSRRNVEHRTGGPFAAAVFDRKGKLIAPGINIVVSANCSVLHAEIVALVLAQKVLGRYDIGDGGRLRYDLVTTTEPCAMCFGAVPWSGVSRLICGARDKDARRIGFDEGPRPRNWVAELKSRGIAVLRNVLREEAVAVLQEYAAAGGPIYNAGPVARRNKKVGKVCYARHFKLIAELRRVIEDVTGCHHPKPERRFHKHDEYLSYGIKTADFREIMKAFRPRFLELPLKERLKLAAELLSEHIGELGHAGIHVLALSVEQLLPCHFPVLDRVADDFTSWSHVDHLCSEVMQPILCKFRGETMALLENWNRSPKPLKRRASVVAFTRKVGESGEFIGEVLRLCENLIWDQDDIVRKAVGWALKDNLRSAPQRVLRYIKDLRRRGVPSTVILYAIRDLKAPERQEILAVKKANG